MRLRVCSVLLLLCACCTLPLWSQDRPADATASAQYPNTAEGLRFFLEQIRVASKTSISDELTALVKQTEIPNYQDWYRSSYPEDQAESWIGRYGSGLQQNEESFRQLFVRLAKTDGRFVIRKVNDDPQPGRGLEWGMLHSASSPLDIYFASWKSESPADLRAEPVGYFLYIAGSFRWDSPIRVIRLQLAKPAPASPDEPGNVPPLSGPVFKVGGQVSPPRVISRVDPEFTDAARKAGLQGTVLLSATIDVDGRPKDIKVLRPLGRGLDEQAVKAFSQWRFTPGTKDGQPVPVEIKIEEGFHLIGRN